MTTSLALSNPTNPLPDHTPPQDPLKPLPDDPTLSNVPPPSPPPLPPPKVTLEPAPGIDDSRTPTLPPINASVSFDNLSPKRTPELESRTPSPAGPALTSDIRSKKSNPLVDLIDTEKLYVEQLTGVIRKVASAWSRSNLPPRELDLMFRSLESVYKANRSLLARLKEIGTNPSSPKALGDLLMRWIDDLDGPYTSYCNRYCVGFDEWEPVRTNDRLASVLAAFSSSTPPPPSSYSSPQSADPPIWTLDQLFLLPKGRLKYYKKLYGRLLKGTQPGRSDHKLLVSAGEKLDRLLATVEARANILAGTSIPQLKDIPNTPSPPAVVPKDSEDEVVVDLRTPPDSSKLQSHTDGPTGSETSDSTRGSSLSSGNRDSDDTASSAADASTAPTTSLPTSIPDLERRLALDRCMDIFTMKFKQFKLQLLPPALPFVREIRMAAEVSIHFVPRSTNVEVLHPYGRIFVLSDLFVICEMMPPEQSKSDSDFDMNLLYPPLAGKFLKVTPVEGNTTAIQVTVMKKEKLFLELGSPQTRNRLLNAFRDCIEFATAIHAASKHPMPPLPSLNGIPPNPENGLSSSQSAPELQRQESQGGLRGAAQNRISSPPVTSPTGSGTFSPPRFGSPAHSEDSMGRSVTESINKLSVPASVQMQPGAQRVPAIHDPGSRTSSFAQAFNDGGVVTQSAPGARRLSPPQNTSIGQTFGPGQVIKPGSFNPGQIIPSQSFSPGQVIPASRMAATELHPRPFPGVPPYQAGPQGLQGGLPPSANRNLPPGPPGPPGLSGPPGPPPAIRDGLPPPIGPQPVRPGLLLGGSQPQHNLNATLEPPRMPIGGSFSTPATPVNGIFPHPNPPFASVSHRAPSDPSFQGGLRKSQSSHSLHAQFDPRPASAFDGPPPLPRGPGSFLQHRSSQVSLSPSHAGSFAAALPSARFVSRTPSMRTGALEEPSPPGSPEAHRTALPSGPVTSTISASMKCKVYLKQQHAQWKSLGSAKLRLYRQDPGNVKQLVVEADDRNKSVLISTIVLTDGVERVGKTGVAVELSDRGSRTGIVYMIQLRNENSTAGLYDSLLAGSDRAS